MRIKVDFANFKYLTKGDWVEFWDQRNLEKRCRAAVMGKTNEYILLKVRNFPDCKWHLLMIPGSYLNFFSQNLIDNLKKGKKVVNILLKKRLALRGRLNYEKQELDRHIEKVNAINARYALLRDKLEKEWQDELNALEENKLITQKNYKDLELRLWDVKSKLQKYKIEDENLKLDRWSLDSRLYFEK